VLGTVLILGATALLVSRAWDDLGAIGVHAAVGAGAIVLFIASLLLLWGSRGGWCGGVRVLLLLVNSLLVFS